MILRSHSLCSSKSNIDGSLKALTIWLICLVCFFLLSRLSCFCLIVGAQRSKGVGPVAQEVGVQQLLALLGPTFNYQIQKTPSPPLFCLQKSAEIGTDNLLFTVGAWDTTGECVIFNILRCRFFPIALSQTVEVLRPPVWLLVSRM